jgi:hypothetical protein
LQCKCALDVMRPVHSTIIMGFSDCPSSANCCIFSDLPSEVKLQIFSFLSATERGLAACVCRDWRDLMRVSTLWTVVDTSQLPVCTVVNNHGSICSTAQIHRACQFLTHVGNTRVVVRCLSLSGDICVAEWRRTSESLFSIVRLNELMTAQLE